MPSRRSVLRLLGRSAAGIVAFSELGRRAVHAETPAAIDKGAGIAMHGAPKYKDDFAHFDYVNAKAPKGGSLWLGVGPATFDSLNPFILKGTGVSGVSSLVFDHLMKRAEDEPFSLYALAAKHIEVPKDRSWAVFELDERARFHDGSPLTPEDVVFSIETLLNKGRPFYRQYFLDVAKAEKVGPRTVRFTFKSRDNRELPLIIAGDLPIFSRAYWEKREFDQVTLERPLGSGPYKVGDFNPGRYIVFERVKDYWAAELPVNRGYSNFDMIRTDYFRDAIVTREAFKAGDFDFRAENQATAWATAYNIDAVRDGTMQKREIRHHLPVGMQAFVFNIRKPLFQDWRVRRALTLAFDFEWTNKNLFYGQYARTKSYFANSEMEATGLPAGTELEILERLRKQFPGRIPDTVFSEPYSLPVYKGDGNIREGLRPAFGLLRAAGWEVRETRLVNKAGDPFRFEILSESQQFERIYLPYIQNLRRLGVAASIRLVDPVQFQKRVENFDFEMITDNWGQSESPGNEQRSYWGSRAADTPGSSNTIGIKDPVIDALIELIIQAPDREQLVNRCKALDRVLLHHHFVLPSWHINKLRLVWWDKFGVPPPHRRGTGTDIWWFDAARAERLKGRIRSLK